MIQCPIHRQFGQRNHLLNRQRGIAFGAFEVERQIAGHDIGRGQGFAGVGQQGFAVDLRGDDEDATWPAVGQQLLGFR